ncbi:hemicentin-1 isoform X1 [Drosophila subobscura]|uniref:hemicentin-1 isoform X1 n=1 Tax=Drosophila subobscura TaxID=7241 RepID=UPI00155A0FB0|nr:hemicentin-1 isoform X1 [Drosophila subobscura]
MVYKMDLLLLLILTFQQIRYIVGSKDVPVHQIESLVGENIFLPCNITTYEGDEPVLVLWYKDDKGTPIYSIDIRAGVSKAPKRWSDESVFGDRAYFIFDKEPGRLSIQNTQPSDSGTFRCRVDFLKAQTINSRVRLNVISPPKQVIIRDNDNVERSTVVGPYSEGDLVILKCQVVGGYPAPTISWYRDGVEMPCDIFHSEGGKLIECVISLPSLGRKDLNSRLTCRAVSHPRAPIVEAVVQIDMNFSPLNIRLLGAHQPLSAGRRYDLLCQSAGSRPPAVITWWQNGIRLEKTTETTSSDGNQTTSTLSISLSKADSGKFLSCKAYNHAVPSEPLEDGWKLDIQYVPEAYVRLGTSLDANTLREGTDVYFDCLVIAHPNVFRIEWRHNDQPLFHNISQGIIISNHSLVLQGVTRSTAGNYSCVGYNAEGEGISAPFALNILYSPTCMQNQKKIYGIAKHEDAKITCVVDANPHEVEFSWTFNNSAESIDVAKNHIIQSGTSSIVTYTPITELDYGTLLCVATNKIGKQRVPCVFHIIAAGRPEKVHNCTLIHVSVSSLTVTCNDGFNGGLPQHFLMELTDSSTHELKANITSTNPRFTVSGLTPGSLYKLYIFSFNTKGRSDPEILNAAMLRMPEKQLTSEQTNNLRAELLFSPVVSLTIGLTLAVLVAILAIILALRIPCTATSRRRQKELSNENISRDESPGPSIKSSASKDLDDYDEKNPDVVPETIDSDDQTDSTRNRQQISTIHTDRSPSRGISVNETQHITAAEMTLRTSHGMGYCTLRSGVHSPVQALAGEISINVTPHVYSSSISQCTLPRQSLHNAWPKYNCNLSGTRPTSTFHQLSFPQSRAHSHHSHSQSLIGHSNGSSLASNSSMPSPSNVLPPPQGRIPLHHINQSQSGKVCMGLGSDDIHSVEQNLSDDEVTVQTPLMIKRDSTV